MSQNIEIEFKNMLTHMEYEKLLKAFHIEKSDIFSQENHYFDTVNFSLKGIGAALRIRKKGDAFEMTLKQPASVGLLETNQIISEDEAVNSIKFGKLPGGEIQCLIEAQKIPFSEIQYFGSLTTNRVEVNYKNGLLVLDHSCYLTKEDYELEYEVENYSEGLKVFKELLAQFTIPERQTDNKIRRFYQQKYTESDSSQW
ncbi:CYTH domain-containing protein [Neobacillus sp. OS1-2]|uniref:CYTH domain-containing protein n=1 Tax=Neobacillus sp. OS1-2 TaxID=3070680 RepID=UPI0027DEE644|nr:CYTH domain-containing protein [Neobacillus sp. OS1-2]WML38803.1 CYTH domain-containing protein [Neobacillus sp. OS1-2]